MPLKLLQGRLYYRKLKENKELEIVNLGSSFVFLSFFSRDVANLRTSPPPPSVQVLYPSPPQQYNPVGTLKCSLFREEEEEKGGSRGFNLRRRLRSPRAEVQRDSTEVAPVFGVEKVEMSAKVLMFPVFSSSLHNVWLKQVRFSYIKQCSYKFNGGCSYVFYVCALKERHQRSFFW